MSAPSPPFDPAEVLTTHTLQAYMDMGRPMLNNYIRYAKVGGGQHGEVYLCYRSDPKLPRIPVAMKSVRRDNPRAEQLKKLRQRRLPTTPHTPLADRLNTTEAKIRKEIAIMKKCRHPHVVRLYEVIDDRMRDKIYMVMEYLGGGEVKWRNDNNEPILTVEQTRRIMRDAVLGLEYLHYQGIIHRDIKPANLLWTEDRRQVKIGDFGVSHFSYAQRLAAAGKEDDKDPHDPILQDDSDLTRRAGTPSFLAPEVVFEHTYEPSPSSGSSSLHAVGSSSTVASLRPRPPITKAIDIWALGVTLYCLLFGKTPFFADPTLPSSEWSLYNSICNNDWDPEETMGFDHIPTGGRHPLVDDSEGTQVMHLLSDFLEKVVTQRITLDEVKRNPWLLRGLPEPEKWLVVTSPTFKINVSNAETSVAMSNVRFSWNWGAVRRIFSHLRPQQQRVRQNNVKRRRRAEDDGRGPVMSDPQMERHKPPSRRPPKPSRKQEIEVNSRTPLVRSYERISETTTSMATAKAQQRSKSIDRWYPSSSRPTTSIIIPTTINHNLNSNNSSPTAVRITGTRTRRGSESQGSQGGTPSSPSGSDRPRPRFSQFIASLSNWRSSGYGGSGSSSSKSVPASDTLGGGGSGGGGTRPLSTMLPRSYPASAMGLPLVGRKCGKGQQVMRRSEEALRHPQRGPYPVYASSSLSSAHHSSQHRGQQQQSQQQQRPYQQGRYTQAVYGNQHHAHSYHPLAVSGGASGPCSGGGRQGSGDGDGDGDGDESGSGYSPPSASGLLTAARRASSWGYEGMDHSEYVDVVSVRSDRVELDESEMIVGAGGVVGGVVGVVSGMSVRALPQGQLANLSGRVVSPGFGMGSGAMRTVVGHGPGPSSSQRVSFYDDDETERARYGPPGFDDSSTIASGSVSGSGSGSGDESSSGEWQRGSGLFLEDDVPEGDDEPGSASGAGGGGGDGGDGGGGGGRDEARKSGEEGDNEDDSEEDDNRVTFSPKRRAPVPS